MAKCRQCNVTILDNTTVCPLCQCVVERGSGSIDAGLTADAGNRIAQACNQEADFEGVITNTGNQEADTDALITKSSDQTAGDDNNTQKIDASIRINEYPDVWLKQRKIKHLCNLILVGVLAAGAVLAVVNIAFSSDSWWSLIPIAAMGYVYAAFRVIFVSRRGYRWKTFVPLILGLMLLLIIDLETGSYGWSLNYVFPAGILVTDIIIVILMLTNLKNWQSYIVMEIVTAVVSLIPMMLWIAGIITNPLLSVIALAVTAALLVAALILGDRTAIGELKRRFHIR